MSRGQPITSRFMTLAQMVRLKMPYRCLLVATCILLVLVGSTSSANPTPEVTQLEESLANRVGEERLQVLYPWLEEHREVQPQAALRFGQEAIDLLTDRVDPKQVFYFYYWTAEAAWYLGDLDLASRLMTSALELARDSGDAEKEFSALLVMASADRRRGEPLEAVKHARRMREVASTPNEEVRALTSLALTYREMEDLPTALDLYLEALEIYLKLPRDEFIGTLLANTGRIYALMGQTEAAIQNTEEALAVLREFGVERDAAYVLYNLGSYQLDVGEYEQARQSFEVALVTLEDLGEEGHVPIYIQSDLAVALALLGRHGEALERSEQALAQAQEKGNEAWLLKATLGDARIKQELGLYREAQQQLEWAVGSAESQNRQFQLADTLRQLAAVHEALGDQKSALEHFRRSADLQDRLVDEKHQRQFAEWRARLSVAEAEQQLAQVENAKRLQAAELRRQRVQRNSFLSTTFLLILLSAGVLYSYRRLHRVHRALEEAHVLLEAKREKLESALSQVKLLSGLLPICSECKSIRADDGYWQMIEQYISEHSEAEFSHGICPDCALRLYPRLKGKLAKEMVSSHPE